MGEPSESHEAKRQRRTFDSGRLWLCGRSWISRVLTEGQRIRDNYDYHIDRDRFSWYCSHVAYTYQEGEQTFC